MLANRRDLYQSWISQFLDIQNFQANADPLEPQLITSFVPSSSQPTEPLVSNPSSGTSFGMDTLDFSKLSFLHKDATHLYLT